MHALCRGIHPPFLAACSAQRLRQSALLWFLRTRLPQALDSVAPTAGAGLPPLCEPGRGYPSASRLIARTKFVLPKLRSTASVPAYDSTYWTLPVMKCFLYSAPSFSLDASFQSCTLTSTHLVPGDTHLFAFLSNFRIAPDGFFDSLPFRC